MARKQLLLKSAFLSKVIALPSLQNTFPGLSSFCPVSSSQTLWQNVSGFLCTFRVQTKTRRVFFLPFSSYLTDPVQLNRILTIALNIYHFDEYDSFPFLHESKSMKSKTNIAYLLINHIKYLKLVTTDIDLLKIISGKNFSQQDS